MSQRVNLAGLFALLAACAQRRADLPTERAVPGAPPFDNLGSHHRPIATDDECVQRYFNQGLILA